MKDPNTASRLFSIILQTREHEMPCDECLGHLAELIDSRAETTGTILEEVIRHLDECDHCREEFEALRAALESDEN